MSLRDDNSVFSSLQAVAGVTYNHAEYNSDIIDTFLLRKARQKGIRLPTGGAPDEYKYLGAFVETPTAGINENVVYADLACFTSDHEIITPDGVRNITNLEVGDPIYTLNEDTLEVEVDTVAQTHDYENTYGEVCNIDHRSVSLSVTENHRFLTYHRTYDGAKRNGEIQSEDYQWNELRDLPSGRHTFPTAEPRSSKDSEEAVSMLELMHDEYVAIYYDGRIPRWDGFPDELAADVETVYGTVSEIDVDGKVGKHIVPIKTYLKFQDYLDELAREVWIVGGDVYDSNNGRCGNHHPIELPKNEFAELLGWFISEGHVGSHNPHRISIAQENDQHRERVNKLLQKLGFHTTTSDRKVSVTSGPLARLLQRLCGDGSEKKKIPEIAFDWSVDAKKILLETLVKGDGSDNKPNVRYYWTKSDQLRDDVLRLTCELGHTPSYWKNDVWRLGYGTTTSLRTREIEKEDHDGRVYCVTGNKNSAILVGKNGQFQWVGNSLYPNNIRSLNVSPETLIGTEQALQESPYTEDDCVWGYIDPRPVKHITKGESWQQYTNGEYKMVYDPNSNSVKWTCDEADGPQYERLYFLSHDVQTGFLTECIQELIDLKNQYRGTPLYASTKRVVNSVYGVVSEGREDSSSRLFDWRIGETITLSGRKIIKGSRDRILAYLHEQGYEDAYACSGDTDATAVALPTVATKDEALRVVGEAVEWLNEEGYDDLMAEEFGVDPANHHTEIEIESFSPRLFIPSQNPPHDDVGVKKRYISWETWNDDDGECDQLSITGLEAERSDIAPVTREAQNLFADVLRLDDGPARRELYPQLRDLAESIRSGEIALSRICKRGGIGQNLHEYGTTNRRPSPIYRGAKYANEHIADVTIQHGDKPACAFIDKVGEEYPSTYTATTAEDGDVVDAITLPDPSLLPDAFQVDYEKHFQKTLKEPLEPLLNTRFGSDSWSEIIHQHSQQNISMYSSQ